MSLSKKIFLFILLILIIIAGGWRQILFTNTNAQIALLQGHITNSGLIDMLSFLGNWELSSLLKLKWVMTVTFALLYFAISALALHIIYQDKRTTKWLAMTYIAIFVLSGLFLALGKVTSSDLGYTISRACMGALQSPFPLMMLIPAFGLVGRENEPE